MEYNIYEGELKLREYGRNIESMVKHLQTVEDVERRSKMAQELMRIMALFSPAVRESKDSPEYRKRLWDHLHQLSDYQLDINGPFPKPEKPNEENNKLTKVAYPNVHPKYKHYGRNVELMIKKALTMEVGSPEREAFIMQIAIFMKVCLQTYAAGVANDQIVFEHLAELSNGEIQLKAEDVTIKNIQPTKFSPSNIPKSLTKMQNRGGRFGNRNNNNNFRDKNRPKKKRLN